MDNTEQEAYAQECFTRCAEHIALSIIMMEGAIEAIMGLEENGRMDRGNEAMVMQLVTKMYNQFATLGFAESYIKAHLRLGPDRVAEAMARIEVVSREKGGVFIPPWYRGTR